MTSPLRALTFESPLRAPPREVLAHLSTLDGVNDELRPLLQMTIPGAAAGQSLFTAPVGQPLFRSWLLLGGWIPVDADDITLESVDPDSGFQEASTMLSMRVWRHERRVAPDPVGCRLIDRLAFEPRLPGTGAALALGVRLVFTHRHRRLRALFGG
jgi:hypothetical protein